MADAEQRVRRCSIASLHGNATQRERPAAEYFIYATPCHTENTCAGRLVCIGHPACEGCVVEIRTGRVEWAQGDIGADVDLTMLHSANVTPPRIWRRDATVLPAVL